MVGFYRRELSQKKTYSDRKDPRPSILINYNSLINHVYHSHTHITPLRFSLTYFLSLKSDFDLLSDFHGLNDPNDSNDF